MNERNDENVTREPLHKHPRAFKKGRGKVYFCLLGWIIYFGTRKQNSAQKTEGGVRLLERFLKMKDEDRKIEDIPAAELNENISEFIISVRTNLIATSTSRLRFEV